MKVGLTWIYVPSFFFYEKKWGTENSIDLVNKHNPKLALTPDLHLDYIYADQGDLEALKKDFEWEEVFRNSGGGVLLRIER